MGFHFSKDVIRKLEDRHGVSQKEVIECFANGEAIYFTDDREEHRTDPPTMWFMAPTNHGRLLKVLFMLKDGDVVIKTAFEPSSDKHAEMYRQKAGLPPCWPNEE